MIDDLKKESVILGSTSFKIKKLPASKALKVFEYMRQHIGQHFNNTLDSDLSTLDSLGVIKSVLSLSADTVHHVMVKLFDCVDFKNGQSGYMPLTESCWDMAFSDMAHMYDLLLRCLVVNFFSSLNQLMDTYRAIAPLTPPKAQKP